MSNIRQIINAYHATNHDYEGAFKRLYYELYSNSKASRAERIIEDLSKLLLCKLICEQAQTTQLLQEFVAGRGSANATLLPILTKAFPVLISENDAFSIGDDAVRRGLAEILPYNLHEAPAHIVGDAFQALMGPRLRGDKGQFFTPRNLVRAMVEVLDPPGDAKIVDPACGTGGFLAEVHAYQKRKETAPLKDTLIGIDKDRDMWRLASAFLAITTQGRATVLNKDSLDLRDLRNLPSSLSPFDADFVLTNPPFGARIGVRKSDILQQFALGHLWSFYPTSRCWKRNEALRGSQDPQVLFIELCVELLRPGGKLGIVLPEGIFGNRQCGYIWDYLRSMGRILALIDCTRTTFQPSTDTKTNVLFFERRRGSSSVITDDQQKVWIAVAVNCGHDRRGRVTNSAGEPYADDFGRIGHEFRQREQIKGVWSQAAITQRYYLVPRYYEQLDAAALIDFLPGWSSSKILSIQEMSKRGYLVIRKGDEVGAEAYGSGDIPFVRTSDISNWEISVDTTKSISEEIYKKYASPQNLHPNDILLVVDGRYRIGRAAILQEHNYRCVVQSHFRIITVTEKAPFSAYEFAYLLSTPFVQRQIRNLIFIQSTLGSLGRRLGELRIPLPSPSSEWQQRVEDFKTCIQERARLLDSLTAFQLPGVEL